MTLKQEDALNKTRNSPYQGLIPFFEDDTSFFFGREKETRLIVANLFATPLTLLYGASGVGKSSVLRAGVVPQLKREEIDLTVIIFNTWQGDPISQLKAITKETCPGISLPSTASLAEWMVTCTLQLNRQMIVILDQFEEYFLYHPLDRGKGSFAAEFSQAVTQSEAPLSFLISIREDSLAKLDRFEGYIPTLFDNYLRLEHLDHNAATEAIVKPVEQFNRLLAGPDKQFSVEPELVEKVIEQVRMGQIIINQMGQGQTYSQFIEEEATDEKVQVESPYLQLVLTHLWDEEIRQNSTVLRVSTLSSLGEANQIIRTHLDEVMKRLKPDQQEVAAHILHYLVTPSGTKIALSAETLEVFTDIPLRRVQVVVDRLSGSGLRILQPVATWGTERMEIRYEIYHDALAPAILDWRGRYFRRETLVERLTRPAIFLAVVAVVAQTFPQLTTNSTLLFLLRGLTLYILHTVALSQVYQWYYRQVRPKVTMLPLAGLGGRNLGILLGLLLPILWYTSTKWEGTLGTITSEQFIVYLFTLVLTLVVGLVTFFGIMQVASQLTYKFFKRFDVGFYLAYFSICLLSIIVIILNLADLIPKWIAW